MKILASVLFLCLIGTANAETFSSNVTVYEYKLKSPVGSKILFEPFPCSMYSDARDRHFWIIDASMRKISSGCYTVENDVLIYKQSNSRITSTLSIKDEKKAGKLVAIDNYYEKYHWNQSHSELLNGGEKPQQSWMNAGRYEDKDGRITLFVTIQTPYIINHKAA